MRRLEGAALAVWGVALLLLVLTATPDSGGWVLLGLIMLPAGLGLATAGVIVAFQRPPPPVVPDPWPRLERAQWITVGPPTPSGGAETASEPGFATHPAPELALAPIDRGRWEGRLRAAVLAGLGLVVLRQLSSGRGGR